MHYSFTDNRGACSPFIMVCSSFTVVCSPFIMESIPYPQHQIIRVFELAQLVSYMQKQMARDVSLESQNLIETVRIIPTAYQVSTNSGID